MGEPTIEPLPAGLVSALSQPTSFPGDPGPQSPIEHIQTHISHVFLTRERVYKLRKAVAFDFLDFGTRASRRFDCAEEVRLNRRLAPDVYLGVAEIHRGEEGFRVAEPEEPGVLAGRGDLETVTVMRRLPTHRDALSLLAAGELSPAQIDVVARIIAEFHRRSRLPAAAADWDWRGDVVNPVRDALASLAASTTGKDEERLRSLDWRTREFEGLHGYHFSRRAREGRRVDGHGDLHLQHIWFDTDGAPRIIDCLEFNRDLREIDAASDVAFLTMDLRYRGVGDLAERALATYTEESDDYDLFGVLRYFEGYRAIVRAKVANLAVGDAAIERAQRDAAAESRSRHLELAERLLEEPRPGPLILTCGWVGTGKSSVAKELAGCLGGMRIASDRVRKHEAGVAPQTSLATGWNQGDYTPKKRRAVYAALRSRAAEVVRSGRTAILDATFSTQEERDAVQSWARDEDVRPWLVEVTCPDDVVTERLRARKRAGSDASDAGPEHLAASRAAYETPREWPPDRRAQIDTGHPSWTAEVAALARRIEAARFG